MHTLRFRVAPSLTAIAIPVLLAGCSHAPTRSDDPRALLDLACAPGMTVQSAKGSVWLKAKSKEASGQFPAVVDAPSADKLKLEVTNLVGGTEAILSVEGPRYKIEVPHHKERNEQGEASWGGIPLQWSNALFLGRIPCPSAASLKDAAIARNVQGELTVETTAALDRQAEKFVYHLRALDGTQWPQTLHWERLGVGNSAPVVVDFKFEDPEDKTHSPLKWEAKSSQGEVKVRWKDRAFNHAASESR